MQNVKVMIPVWAKGPEFGLQEWPIDKEEQGYMYARKIPLIVSHIPTLFCLEIFLNVLGFVFLLKHLLTSPISFGKYSHPVQEELFLSFGLTLIPTSFL